MTLLSTPADRVKIAELATSVGTQLRRADTALRHVDSPIRMGPVTLSLKGALMSEDDQMAMRFAKGVERPDQLSEVTMHFTAGSVTKPGAAPGLVPDLLGYTEALARRKASAAGYPIELRREAIAPGQEARRGRVVHQRPAGGEALAAGSKVEIYLGY